MTIQEAKTYLKRGDLTLIAQKCKVHRNSCYSAIVRDSKNSIVNDAIITMAKSRAKQIQRINQEIQEKIN